MAKYPDSASTKDIETELCRADGNHEIRRWGRCDCGKNRLNGMARAKAIQYDKGMKEYHEKKGELEKYCR